MPLPPHIYLWNKPSKSNQSIITHRLPMNRSRQGRIVSPLLRGLKSAMIDFLAFEIEYMFFYMYNFPFSRKCPGRSYIHPVLRRHVHLQVTDPENGRGGTAGSTRALRSAVDLGYLSSARISTSLQRASMYLVQARREGRETDVDQNLVISLPNAQVKNLFNNQPYHQNNCKKESKHTNIPESTTDSSN